MIDGGDDRCLFLPFLAAYSIHSVSVPAIFFAIVDRQINILYLEMTGNWYDGNGCSFS